MYRTFYLPGGKLLALGVVLLSFLAPGVAAAGLGFTALHTSVLGWIFLHRGPAFLALMALYGLFGFAVLMVTAFTALTAGRAALNALSALQDAAGAASLSLARLLAELIAWPLQDALNRLQARSERGRLWVAEQRQLWTLYHTRYAQDFPRYRDFRSFWRARPDTAPSSPLTPPGAPSVAPRPAPRRPALKP